VRIWHVPPGAPTQLVVATSDVGGQLAVVQHVPPAMQMLPQTVSPGTEQLHVPATPEQVSPMTGQPVAGQQLVVGMHVLLVVQKVWFAGQLQEPPGPEQCPPPTHWASVQHDPEGMHELNGGDAMVQTEPLFGQMQLPPGPVQVSFVTRQSLLVQHVLVGMHVLFTGQTLLLAAHAHTPPGDGQVSPLTAMQSGTVVQHDVLGMQELFAVQAL